MKKQIAMMAAAAVLSVMMAIPSLAGSWKYDSNGWRYQRSASKYAIQEWVTVDGKKYYMDSNGFMVTGWQQIDGQWYYMDDTGAMQTGWLKDGLDWYFLSPLTGAMVVNTVIEGRQIDGSGKWVPAEGQTEPVGSSMNLTEPVLVQNMEGLRSKGYTIIAMGRTASYKETWSNAMRFSGTGSYVRFNTNGEYQLLAGVFSPSTTFDGDLMGRLVVIGDNDQVLYTSQDIHYNEKPIPFAVDVTGQTEVEVKFELTIDNHWDTPVLLIDQLSLYR